MVAKIQSFYILQRNSNSPLFNFDSLCLYLVFELRKNRNPLIFGRKPILKLSSKFDKFNTIILIKKKE